MAIAMVGKGSRSVRRDGNDCALARPHHGARMTPAVDSYLAVSREYLGVCREQLEIRSILISRAGLDARDILHIPLASDQPTSARRIEFHSSHPVALRTLCTG